MQTFEIIVKTDGGMNTEISVRDKHSDKVVYGSTESYMGCDSESLADDIGHMVRRLLSGMIEFENDFKGVNNV